MTVADWPRGRDAMLDLTRQPDSVVWAVDSASDSLERFVCYTWLPIQFGKTGKPFPERNGPLGSRIL